MTRLALVLATLSLAAGCKKKQANQSPPAITDGGAAAPVDGLVDETEVRAGKRTGMEAPDQKPEVATEPLMRALIGGQTPWLRFIDPATGVVELRSLPGTDAAPAEAAVTRRCGADLDQAVAAFALAATAALADPGLIYDTVCDNVGLAVAVPGVTSHAVCSVSSPADDGLELDLVFVPDPVRGLRLIGVSTADTVSTPDALRDQFDEELGRFGARCP